MTFICALPAQSAEREEWLEIVAVRGEPSVYSRIAGQISVSIARSGDRYRLPVDVKAGPHDSAEVVAQGVRVDVAPNSTLQFVASDDTKMGLGDDD